MVQKKTTFCNLWKCQFILFYFFFFNHNTFFKHSPCCLLNNDNNSNKWTIWQFELSVEKSAFPVKSFSQKCLSRRLLTFRTNFFPHFHSLEELLIRKLQIKVSRFLLPFVNFTLILCMAFFVRKFHAKLFRTYILDWTFLGATVCFRDLAKLNLPMVVRF